MSNLVITLYVCVPIRSHVLATSVPFSLWLFLRVSSKHTVPTQNAKWWHVCKVQGSAAKLTSGIGISVTKIRPFHKRFIYTLGTTRSLKPHLYAETASVRPLRPQHNVCYVTGFRFQCRAIIWTKSGVLMNEPFENRFQCKAIILTKFGVLMNGPFENRFQCNLNQYSPILIP